jgi:Pectinacetylesterase
MAARRAARLALVLSLAVAVAVVAAGSANDVADPGWQRIEPGGRTACARGGGFAFWARLADPRRVVLFFQGGGGCFDERTCAVGSDWFDDSVDASDNPSFAGGGMLDLAHDANPFRRWSWVFIPSCTGDVHVGDRQVRYGRIVVEQRGWQNARAALRWAFAHIRRPEVVLVAGCSAGSVGSAFHVPAVLDRWPNARVSQLGDSLAFVFHRPVTLRDWGAHRHFPEFFRIGPRRFTMVEYLTRLAKRYPGRTFARFNHSEDSVQQAFYGAVGGNPSGFERRLRAAEAALKRLPNYRSYLACGSEHCALPTYEFFSLRVRGVPLRDWVASLAAGRDVSCPTCR